MRVLLVEDNQRLNHELQMSLVDEGYAVDMAFDGVEGQAFAESTPYDVLILDILLPGKDGLEVCRDLRRQHINTPMVFLLGGALALCMNMIPLLVRDVREMK